jgi:hypothetical protein
MRMLSWVFVYIAAFGLSDMFVKQYVSHDTHLLLYYGVIALIGYRLSF